jgi:tRNA (mo5U34)-methyltransferase
MTAEFATVLDAAAQFNRKLVQAKRDLGPVDFPWYPYGTFTALTHLDRLLTGANRGMFSGKKLRILDVGCGDGELSFFLESLGHEVVAVDHHLYSHNGMRGVQTLKQALGSAVEIHETDLDRQFALPHDAYDVTLMLGVLYHLRNPFYVLEELARRSSQCLLSTRIARRFPGGKAMPADAALAYLVDERELNGDDSNYFIFSEAGLRVALKRTWWEVRDYMTTKDTNDSEPVRLDRDERAFCLLESRYERFANVELLEGWYDVEDAGWRWTQREFAARVRGTESFHPRAVSMRLFLAEKLMRRCNPLHVSMSLNGRPLKPEVFRSAGPQELVRTLRGDPSGEFVFRFQLSGALPPDENDRRELGVIVESMRVE